MIMIQVKSKTYPQMTQMNADLNATKLLSSVFICVICG